MGGSRRPDPDVRPGAANALTDVTGLRVGHAERIGAGWLSGVTVVLAPAGGVVAAVDVRGGGPGTRETDALDPRNLVERIDAVVLTGGSAYGLDAASGVAGWLEEHGRGVRVGPRPWQVVPVVPAAALFDLGRGGDWRARPDPALGRAAVVAAAASAEGGPVGQGNRGAGTGAVAGGMKGGVGTASAVLPSGLTVAALAVVNSAGSPTDPATGLPYGLPTALGTEFAEHGLPRAIEGSVLDRARRQLASAHAETVRRMYGGDPATERPPNSTPAERPLNTTLAVVATDAGLSRSQAHKLAGAAHAGLARAVRPVHLLTDGDTVFALATGTVPLVPPDAVGNAGGTFGGYAAVGALNAALAAGADVLTRAVVHAVLNAESIEGRGGIYPAYRELYRT